MTTETITIEYNGQTVDVPATKQNTETLSTIDDVDKMLEDAEYQKLKRLVKDFISYPNSLNKYKHLNTYWVRMVTHHGSKVSLDKGEPARISNHPDIEIKMIRDSGSTSKKGIYIGYTDE